MSEIERPECGHCHKPVLGWGMADDTPPCHTGTLPPDADPIDCYRLVTLHRHQTDGSCCRAAPAPAAPTDRAVLIPRDALALLVKVAKYVSIGRGGVGHQPDGAPYPDATARIALGMLGDADIDLEAL